MNLGSVQAQLNTNSKFPIGHPEVITHKELELVHNHHENFGLLKIKYNRTLRESLLYLIY